MSERNGLPKHWRVATINEAISDDGVFVDGDWIESKDQDLNGDVRLIQLADIGDGSFKDKSARFLTLQRAKELNCTFLKEGDVLVARMPDPIGRACIFPLKSENKYVTAVDVAIIRSGTNGVNNKFLMYAINNPQIRNEIEGLQSGTTRKRISRKNLATILFSLPPLAEQQRIVAKLEELFSELDAGLASLKTAARQLKTYRQAVLKWAFEGKLTNDSVNEGELPAGWTWVKLGDFLQRIEAGKSFKCDERPPKGDETGIVKVSAVTWGEFAENESKTILSKDQFRPEFLIRKDDFLFSRANTIELVGACIIVKTVNKKLMLSDKTLRFIFNENVKKEFVLYYLRSRIGRREIESLATGNQDSMRNIGQERIKQIAIPLCPLEEQHRIVQEIESRLSVCEKLEETLAASLRQAEALRQSILKQAFAGKLVAPVLNSDGMQA